MAWKPFFERSLPDEPATHAFVIGVGDYPHRHPAWGGLPELNKVRSLPSAADSAKFVTDWLIQNKDCLAAKLGSIEVVISDPPGGEGRYPWGSAKQIGRANVADVKTAGRAWLGRVKPGDVAFFYCCGHGAAHSSQPVLFLEDLNATKENPWSHLNIGKLGQALRRKTELRCAFMFADTCGEFIPNFEFGDAQDTRFFAPPRPFDIVQDKVSLICAAPQARLAYEGADPATGVRLGRFTQTVIKGLDGSSARMRDNRWIVYPSELLNDLKTLRRIFFPLWDDLPFEPSPALTQNDVYPIVHRQDPEVPVLIITDPADAVIRFNLHVSERNEPHPPWISSRPARSAGAWSTSVKAGMDPLYALAVTDAEFFSSRFYPNQPQINQRVPVR
jgi:hypothetical protein